MRHVAQEWCAAAVERLKRHGCLVWRARLPTPREEAHPWAGHGAHGCLVRLARVAWLRGGDLRPAGMPWRFRRPLHTRLAQARRPLAAPGAPGLRAPACRHGRHPRLVLACLGSGVAFPLCAKGHEEAWSQDRPGPWHGGKQREGGRLLGAVRAGCLDGGHGLHGDAEWGHEGVHTEGMGGG
jgi:hypothetical protein